MPVGVGIAVCEVHGVVVVGKVEREGEAVGGVLVVLAVPVVPGIFKNFILSFV